MLERIQIDLAAVQCFIRQCICIKTDKLDVDVVAVVIQDLLDCFP